MKTKHTLWMFNFATALTIGTGLAGPLQAEAAPAADTPAASASTFPTPPAQPDADLRSGVQVTEIGCMRALLLLDKSAVPLEKLIAQRLSDVDFRVFPSARALQDAVSHETMKEMGKEAQADLVIYATVSSRLKNKLDDFQLYEGEATVQAFNPVTGELLVTHTSRASGVRNVDAVEAERSGREKALDAASRETITKLLEKAHKIIVYRATITGVASHNHLLAIMEYIQKLKGIHHVRQISYDPDKQVAVLEMVGSPKADSFWRAYLEKLPKTKQTIVVVTDNAQLRTKYPAWFTPDN